MSLHLIICKMGLLISTSQYCDEDDKEITCEQILTQRSIQNMEAMDYYELETMPVIIIGR